ncbi:MAG: hypothetical protein ACXVH2_00755 [Methanobacterium sp.]
MTKELIFMISVYVMFGLGVMTSVFKDATDVKLQWLRTLLSLIIGIFWPVFVGYRLFCED